MTAGDWECLSNDRGLDIEKVEWKRNEIIRAVNTTKVLVFSRA